MRTPHGAAATSARTASERVGGTSPASGQKPIDAVTVHAAQNLECGPQYGIRRPFLIDGPAARRSGLNPTQVRLASQDVVADTFKVRPTPLQLLRHAVDISQSALERLSVEDRRGTRLMENPMGDIPRRVDRIGGGLPDLHAALQ